MVRLQALLLPPDLVRDLGPGAGGGGGGGCDQSSASGDMTGLLDAKGAANKFLRAAPELGFDGGGVDKEGNTIKSRHVTLELSVKSNLNQEMTSLIFDNDNADSKQ